MRTLIVLAALTAVAACQQETKIEEAPEAAEITTPGPPPTTITIMEADARSLIEAQGYTNVTGLTQNPDGTWTATGTRDGAATQLSIGPSGVTVVTAPATP